MSCNHIMVDLETMGTSPGCAIATIGAVMFDPVKGLVGNSFYVRIGLQSCVEAGLNIEPETVLWWMRQSDAARHEIVDSSTLNLRAALDSLAVFMAASRAKFFWSHGSNFDGPVLAAAYAALQLKAPWKFWDARDTRTIFDLAGVKPDRTVGVAHNARVDAENQVAAVFEAYRKLGLAKQADAA